MQQVEMGNDTSRPDIRTNNLRSGMSWHSTMISFLSQTSSKSAGRHTPYWKVGWKFHGKNYWKVDVSHQILHVLPVLSDM